MGTERTDSSHFSNNRQFSGKHTLLVQSLELDIRDAADSDLDDADEDDDGDDDDCGRPGFKDDTTIGPELVTIICVAGNYK